ncbi:hypothetical protein L6452_26572 [Arctium lappa]|uniref:Uncharacterized protein n=1 Tax=Arctium lappa TaxID=4217 RepID=A0ACB8ZVU3_ARCLA|nr:hypothetical protein L6452_26572 [Arctium lappa]
MGCTHPLPPLTSPLHGQQSITIIHCHLVATIDIDLYMGCNHPLPPLTSTLTWPAKASPLTTILLPPSTAFNINLYMGCNHPLPPLASTLTWAAKASPSTTTILLPPSTAIDINLHGLQPPSTTIDINPYMHNKSITANHHHLVATLSRHWHQPLYGQQKHYHQPPPSCFHPLPPLASTSTWAATTLYHLATNFSRRAIFFL